MKVFKEIYSSHTKPLQVFEETLSVCSFSDKTQCLYKGPPPDPLILTLPVLLHCSFFHCSWQQYPVFQDIMVLVTSSPQVFPAGM